MLFVYSYLLGFRLVFDASFHLFSSLYLCCFGAVVINLSVVERTEPVSISKEKKT